MEVESKRLTPGEAVHAFCVDCVDGGHNVRDCGGDKCQNGGSDNSGVCLFYKYRLGKGRVSVRLIRRMCLWCSGNQEGFVRECKSDGCTLYPFRMGKNPARKGKGGRGFPGRGASEGDAGLETAAKQSVSR